MGVRAAWWAAEENILGRISLLGRCQNPAVGGRWLADKQELPAEYIAPSGCDQQQDHLACVLASYCICHFIKIFLYAFHTTQQEPHRDTTQIHTKKTTTTTR